MLLVNTDYISGKELETIGIVKGNIVQTKNFGKDFMAGIKTLVGGEIVQYTENHFMKPKAAFITGASRGMLPADWKV